MGAIRLRILSGKWMRKRTSKIDLLNVASPVNLSQQFMTASCAQWQLVVDAQH